ncbi:MAG: sugar phosphate nucleotidyltransferase [Thermodesulfobacteriota bacterium]|nr:sugar phosphate nucleotidyltransferase [Thermodesulfobacteriota bacterium]
MIKGRKDRFSTIILAAGKGTRMNSSLAKVLHPICEKPMLSYSVAVAREAGSEETVIVVGHQAELVKESIKGNDLVFVYQMEQLGTGHAVLQAKDMFLDFEGTILILCGDVPLLTLYTVRTLLDYHFSGDAAVTILTTILDIPSGYGRVIKKREGDVLKVVEERDATYEEKKIKEINTGIYCVESGFLFEAAADIDNKNAQGEYYLTDIFEIARKGGYTARAFIADDPVEVMGINTPDDLKLATRIIEKRKELAP